MKGKGRKTLEERNAAVLDFLSGKGPNPLPEKARGPGGPEVRKFMAEVAAEVADQDKENANLEARPASRVCDSGSVF